MVERRTIEIRCRRWPPVILIAIGIAGALWPKAHTPLLAWNGSRSVPVGLYYIVARPPRRGELAVLRLPEPMRTLTEVRGYLPPNAVLIKPVAALSPDHVCRKDGIVTINGLFAARVLTTDPAGRPMPQWSGCHYIDERHFFMLSNESNGFDGRYFGLVDAHYTFGTAAAVWTVGRWLKRLPEFDGCSLDAVSCAIED